MGVQGEGERGTLYKGFPSPLPLAAGGILRLTQLRRI